MPSPLYNIYRNTAVPEYPVPQAAYLFFGYGPPVYFYRHIDTVIPEGKGEKSSNQCPLDKRYI